MLESALPPVLTIFTHLELTAIQNLLQCKTISKRTSDLDVDGTHVTFTLSDLPNDMKMLALLAGNCQILLSISLPLPM